MRFLFVTGLIGSASLVLGDEAAVAGQLEGPLPKALEEVYGDAAEFAQRQPVVSRTLRLAKPAAYYASRAAEVCNFPLDVAIVQDATGSFAPDYENMRNTQLKLVYDGLTATHPGSRFGLVSFKDRPVRTLGEPWDYCHRYDLPLQTDYTALYNAYGTLWSAGGQDPAENQFGAMIAALQSGQMGWQANGLATKLVVVATDSWPHFADDGLQNPAYGMGPNTGVLDADEATQCRYQYYPSPTQVKQVMVDKSAYGAFLVFGGNYGEGLVRRSWDWFNEYLGQSPGFVEDLENHSANFWEALGAVIAQVEAAECGVTSTSTIPTTATTVPTTVMTTVPTETTLATTVPTETVPTTVVTTTVATETTTTTAVPTETTVPTATIASTPPATPTTEEDVTVTPVGTAQTLPPDTPATEPCPCPPEGACGCPEVVIKLRHRPAQLHLVVSNEPEVATGTSSTPATV